MRGKPSFTQIFCLTSVMIGPIAGIDAIDAVRKMVGKGWSKLHNTGRGNAAFSILRTHAKCYDE